MTSVYKLLILCVVPNVKETYDNVKIMIDLTKLNDIPFKFVSDFKLLHIVNVQQTATASFPCPYCFVPLQCLRCGEEENIPFVSYSETIENPKQYENNLETFGDLREDPMAMSGLHTWIPNLLDASWRVAGPLSDTCQVADRLPS